MPYGSSGGWIGFGGQFFEMSDKIVGCDAGFDSRAPNLDLYDPVRKPFVADDDLDRERPRIGIVEFDTGAIGTVIPQYFKARTHQIGIETRSGLGRLL